MTVVALPAPLAAPDPDIALVRAMADGDTHALRALYSRYGRDVHAYVQGRLDDRGLAEEVTQDVMLSAWRGAPGFRADSTVRTWLLAIAHNCAMNAVRRRRVPTTPVDPDQVDRRNTSSPHAELVHERLDTLSAVRRLPDHQRAALQLVFFHGLTFAQAADVLGVPEGTVKSRVHRAEAAVRRELALEDESDV